MIVGLAAGAATDTIGRIIADRMKSSVGQRIIVENVTGAGGTIAAGRVARAAPDGYTLGIGNNGQYVTAFAAYALQYDLLNDFEPVALLSTGPSVLLARKAMPANDLKGFDRLVKGHSGQGDDGYRKRQCYAYRRCLLPKRNGHALSVRALYSGSHSGRPGLDGKSN
jgi:tripartite-type tricarboxylate transporter receptor subunit TctC